MNRRELLALAAAGAGAVGATTRDQAHAAAAGMDAATFDEGVRLLTQLDSELAMKLERSDLVPELTATRDRVRDRLVGDWLARTR